MSEQQNGQINTLAGKLVEFQRHFGKMSSDDRQWVIQNTEVAIGLFAAAVKNRTAPVEKKLLERLMGTIALPAIKDFTVKRAKVKLSHISDNFKKYFLAKVEKSEVAAEELSVYELLEYAHDPAIIIALGGEAKVEITLGQFFALFAKQPNGEAGALLTNGFANVGYIRDSNGILSAVSVCWYGAGWDFAASALDYPYGRDVGARFFSR